MTYNIAIDSQRWYTKLMIHNCIQIEKYALESSQKLERHVDLHIFITVNAKTTKSKSKL